MFYWYDSSRPSEAVGPYFTSFENKIGKKKFYTRDEMLQLEGLVPATTFKKICSAKSGASVKIINLHSCGDLYIRRMTDIEISSVMEINSLKEEVDEINKQIRVVAGDLLDKKAKVEYDIKKKRDKLKIKF